VAGKAAAGERLGRARRAWTRAQVGRGAQDLAKRVRELEAEVAELRQQSLRIAELADVVQELLIPLASRDQERIDAAIAEYRKGL